MKLVDANVLLYSVDQGAEHHASAKSWLDAHVSGVETVLMPWVALLAFIRVSTHPRVYSRPLQVSQALDVVDGWLSQPAVVVPEADRSHLARMRIHLRSTGVGGNLVNDAHLAAIAVQHDATVVTYDSDFGRFPGVTWESPPPIA